MLSDFVIAGFGLWALLAVIQFAVDQWFLSSSCGISSRHAQRKNKAGKRHNKADMEKLRIFLVLILHKYT